MSGFPYTRREFLRSTARGAGLLALGAHVPAFVARTAAAVAPAKDSRILVVIQLGGGNDGLNTVIPHTDDAYHAARPVIGIRSPLRLTDHTGLHSSMQAAHGLYQDGRLLIVQNTGYPNPDRSHFRSMEIWQSGRTTVEPGGGWLGRYFDAQCAGADPITRAAIGVALDRNLPQAFLNGANAALAVHNPDTFRWNNSGETSGLARAQQQIFEKLNRPGSGAPAMRSMEDLGGIDQSNPETVDFLRHTAMNAVLAGDRIRKALEKQSDAYPAHDLARQLRMIASLIRSDLPTRVYYAGMGGFDTHSGQIASHARLLSAFSESVATFLADLRRQQLGDKVLVLAFSEFGRRVAENASAGTDHGAAAPVFLFGDRVKGGLAGGSPDLKNLVDGDLRHQIDFRQVYAGILTDWLGTPATPILGRSFEKIPIVG